jgi:hypothetical protein
MSPEIIKIITWPVVATIALFAFRQPISEWMGRISKIKAKDIEVESGAGGAIAQQTESKVPEITLAAEHSTETRSCNSLEATKKKEGATGIDVAPIVIEEQQQIRQYINGLNVPQTEAINILISLLAVTYLKLRAETIYRVIFGSQIKMLKALNLFGAKTKEELAVFYELAKTQYPSISSYSFENYLNYLITNGLIAQEQDDKFAITSAGKEFLKYLVDISANEDKPF